MSGTAPQTMNGRRGACVRMTTLGFPSVARMPSTVSSRRGGSVDGDVADCDPLVGALSSCHQSGCGGAPWGKAIVRQLGERLDVDRALEIDDFPYRLPAGAPSATDRIPAASVLPKSNATGVRLQAQQEPALLLPDAHGLLVAAHVPRRQPVAQPTRDLAEQLARPPGTGRSLRAARETAPARAPRPCARRPAETASRVRRSAGRETLRQRRASGRCRRWRETRPSRSHRS